MAQSASFMFIRSSWAFMRRIGLLQLPSSRLAPAQRCIHLTAATCVPGVVEKGENPLELTNKDWEKRLAPNQYYVCREKGTEMPFSGELLHNQEQGTYHCVCCGVALFSSKAKFDSGSGWPSFYEALVSEESGETNVLCCGDNSHGMIRKEVVCRKCDAHLGHIFPDGPQPTGERFCLNSASLGFSSSEPESSSNS